MTDRETATVLAALRFWQRLEKTRYLARTSFSMEKGVVNIQQPEDVYFENHKPLDNAEIDALIEKLNAPDQPSHVNTDLLDIVYAYWQSRSEEQWLKEEPEIHAAIIAAVKKAKS